MRRSEIISLWHEKSDAIERYEVGVVLRFNAEALRRGVKR